MKKRLYKKLNCNRSNNWWVFLLTSVFLKKVQKYKY